MSRSFTWDAVTEQELALGVDTWTDILFENSDGEIVTDFTWPNGERILLHFQLAVLQVGPRLDSAGKLRWASWVDVQIMQYLKDRPGAPDDDATALKTMPIVKRRQGELITVEMDTLPDERYRIHMQHDGKVKPVLDKGILKVGPHVTEVVAS